MPPGAKAPRRGARSTAFSVSSPHTGRERPWRKVPIPRYDETISLHRKIVGLCTPAEKIAARTVTADLEEAPQRRQSRDGRMRTAAVTGASNRTCTLAKGVTDTGSQDHPESLADPSSAARRTTRDQDSGSDD